MNLKITNKEELNQAVSELKKLDPELKWEISWRRYRRRRTLPQNSLYWVWLNYIYSETGNTPDYMHEYFKRLFLPWEAISVFGEKIMIGASTTALDTKEFNTYLEQVRMHILEKTGLDLPYPDSVMFEDFYRQYKKVEIL